MKKGAALDYEDARKKSYFKEKFKTTSNYPEEKSATPANKFEYFGAILTSDEVQVAMKCGWP